MESVENWAQSRAVGHNANMRGHVQCQPSLHLGEVHFVDEGEASEWLAAADNDDLLPLRISVPGPRERGHLGLWLEANIDTSLEIRGALPPGVGASTNLDASLSDQLYRARLIGKRGFCLYVPSLEKIADLRGVLDASDSQTLRFWSHAIEGRPIQLLLDRSNLELRGFGAPVELALMLHHPGASSESEDGTADHEPAESSSVTVTTSANTEETAATCTSEHSLPDHSAVEQAKLANSLLPPLEPVSTPTTGETDGPSVTGTHHQFPDTDPEASSDSVAADIMAHLEDVTGPNESVDPSVPWRTWMAELDSARGPKPLAAIERLFTTSYVPLLKAWLEGRANEGAALALETWAKSFERSYREAFDALCHRGRRPSMVLDVPDVASRMARLHGARTTQLVLVDALRFDLGLMVEQHLQQKLKDRASLAERLLLWSALPTDTTTQIELLGRGPKGLVEYTKRSSDDDRTVVVAHGKAAATPRRVKAGHRDLLKLDLVESNLASPGAPAAERLDELASETADALAELFSKLPPRTLVVVFGDHGFRMEPFDGGTSRGYHGGASPEEVLVPGMVWLTGEVH